MGKHKIINCCNKNSNRFQYKNILIESRFNRDKKRILI